METDTVDIIISDTTIKLPRGCRFVLESMFNSYTGTYSVYRLRYYDPNDKEYKIISHISESEYYKIIFQLRMNKLDFSFSE